MRACLFLLVLLGMSAIAQTETNMACVERLQIPAYPPLAVQARIVGVLTASVRLGSDGSITKISSLFAPTSEKENLLKSAVEESLRASTFAKSCAGQQVRLVFNFVVTQAKTSTQLKFSFGYPNQFWIEAPVKMYVD
jgi:hypothetical protein